MKTQITINSESFEVKSISAGFAGYGHQNVSCDFVLPNGTTVSHSIITTDTQMTDDMKDDNEEVENEAKEMAAKRVIENYLEKLNG